MLFDKFVFLLSVANLDKVISEMMFSVKKFNV